MFLFLSSRLRLIGRVTIWTLLAAVLSMGAMATGVSESPAGESAEAEQIVHVYSHRHYQVDRDLYDRFEQLTGIEVQVVEAGADELIQRLAAEGESSKADVLITVDAGRLHQAKTRGLLQPIEDNVLSDAIPSHLRDPEGEWFGLTIRSRIIAYHKGRVDPGELSTYEALAGDLFNDRVAIRSSNNIYNISLLSSLVAHHGPERAQEWAQGMTESMAREPSGNDRDQLRAVASGQADVAVVNTYYVALMANSPEPADREVVDQIGVFFPNQPGTDGSGTSNATGEPLATRGAHINVSGGGVTSSADNVDGAVQLLRFLVSPEAQETFAAANYEYPVLESVSPAPTVAEWGEFKMDTLSLAELGENAREATMIFDRVGWR